MERLVKIFLVGAVAFTLGASTAQADAGKGQKRYSKLLKAKCGMSGGDMAKKHTQDEWEEIMEEGELEGAIQKICPKVNGVKEKYLQDLYDFFYEYASDSGNVPSC